MSHFRATGTNGLISISLYRARLASGKMFAADQRVHSEERSKKYSSVIGGNEPTRPNGTRGRLVDFNLIPRVKNISNPINFEALQASDSMPSSGITCIRIYENLSIGINTYVEDKFIMFQFRYFGICNRDFDHKLCLNPHWTGNSSCGCIETYSVLIVNFVAHNPPRKRVLSHLYERFLQGIQKYQFPKKL